MGTSWVRSNGSGWVGRMRTVGWKGGALALTIPIVLVGCVPLSAPDSQDVQGTIDSSNSSAVGVCHLAVTTITGEPVGETAQVVEEGDRFSWPLFPGDYVLNATCASTKGELEVHVPSAENSDLMILVS